MRTAALLLIALATNAYADTTWISPRGGAWNNPANWSNGVPDANANAILPALDGDGYVIELPPSAAAHDIVVRDARASGMVILHGGALSVASLAVGAPSAAGGLRLDGASLQAGAITVGAADGEGTLEVRNGAVLGSSSLLSGTDGTGTIDATSGTQLVVGSLVLGSQSTLKLQITPYINWIALVSSIQCGGALIGYAGPGLAIPTPPITLINSSSLPAGAFATIDGPVMQGYEIQIAQVGTKFVVNFDPVVGVNILFNPTPLYAGFDYELNETLALYSGNGAACNWACDNAMTWSASGGDVTWLSGPGLTIGSAEPFELTATYTQPTYEVSTTIDVVASDQLPNPYDVASSADDGTPGNGSGLFVSMLARWSSDSRYVAFASTSTNLDPPPTDGYDPWNLYRKDRLTGDVQLIAANEMYPDISADGRYIVAHTYNPPDDIQQIWLHDALTGASTLVSHAPDGSPANDGCGGARISADGSTVVFTTQATNLGAAIYLTQVFAYDVATDVLTLVSKNANGEIANQGCENAALSGDGSRIVFSTGATNLVSDNVGDSRIVVLDRRSGAFTRIDVNNSGAGATGQYASMPQITPSGRYVCFASNATNLGDPVNEPWLDIFVRDLELETTTFVSPTPSDNAHYQYDQPSLSDDGAFVVFCEEHLGSQPGPKYKIRRVNLATLNNEVVVLDQWNAPPNVPLAAPALNHDGSMLLFCGGTTRLVPFGGTWKRQAMVRALGPFAAGDLNCDGLVNATDLSILLGAWSTSGPGDLDGDGVVGAGDLALLLGAWSS